jgi:hypothetical protein
MPFTKQILNPLNQCKLTSIEKVMYNCRAAYTTFQDNDGRIRLIFSHRYSDRPNKPVCGLFLERVNTNTVAILGVYTIPSERRRGFAKMLLASAKIRFKNVLHSENLTVDGEAWRDSVEGLK